MLVRGGFGGAVGARTAVRAAGIVGDDRPAGEMAGQGDESARAHRRPDDQQDRAGTGVVAPDVVGKRGARHVQGLRLRLGHGCPLRRVLGHNSRMDLGLRDRVYLVTGGSRGLGFAAAQALVADGARVVLSAPHETTASSAAARLAQDATVAAAVAWVVADNADPAAPGQLIAGDPPVRAHPAAPVRGTGGVWPGRGVPALPRRVLHHRRDGPGRRRCHQLDLSRGKVRAWAAVNHGGARSRLAYSPM